MIQLVLFICTAFAVEAEIGETDASKMAKMCATEAASTEYPILVRKLQRRLCGMSIEAEIDEMDASKRAKLCATDASSGEHPEVLRELQRRLCGTSIEAEIGEVDASKRAKLCATDAASSEYPEVLRELQRRLCGTSIEVSSDSAQSLIFELASTPNNTLVIALAFVGFAATLYVVKKILCRQKYAQLDYATAEEV